MCSWKLANIFFCNVKYKGYIFIFMSEHISSVIKAICQDCLHKRNVQIHTYIYTKKLNIFSFLPTLQYVHIKICINISWLNITIWK